MHGLIFETSIWLLAGSTRFLPLTTQRNFALQNFTCWKVQSSGADYKVNFSRRKRRRKAEFWFRITTKTTKRTTTSRLLRRMPQFPSRRPTLHRNCEVAMLDVVAHHQFAKRTNTNSQNYSLEKQFFPPFVSEIADALTTASAGPAILETTGTQLEHQWPM